uniref:GPI inositol-deacylase n=1 Tax=Panagrolaimus superbus TaxID=310955 RepID=A0A914XWY2_9BILA
MPIAMSHDAMRHTLAEVFKHFDPSGKAQASHDMVLVGHSMGGVIARLMVSSSGDHLVDTLLATAQMTPAQRELLRTKGAPVLTFLPEPEVSRVVFIATPHRGTDVAGTRLGRWIGRLHPEPGQGRSVRPRRRRPADVTEGALPLDHRPRQGRWPAGKDRRRAGALLELAPAARGFGESDRVRAQRAGSYASHRRAAADPA